MSHWKLKNVYISYNYASTAIADCNFCIEKGEKVAFIGDVGSGKTSLMLAMCGLLPLTSGVIEIYGKDATNISTKDRDVLYIPDRDQLFRLRSVRYNLTYPLKKRGVSKTEIENRLNNALSYFGILDKSRKIVASLSSYDKARVAYARLLMRDASTLIIDDYYRNLEEPEQQKLLQMLLGIVKNSTKTVAMATKNYEMAKVFADKIFLVDNSYVIPIDKEGVVDTYAAYRIKTGNVATIATLGKDKVGLYVEVEEECIRLVGGSLIDDIFVGDQVLFCREDNILFDIVSERKIFG